MFVSVVSTRQMWTATNVFIANLALTDLIVCAFDLPVSLHYQVRAARNLLTFDAFVVVVDHDITYCTLQFETQKL